MAAWCLCRLLCGLDGDSRSGGLRRAHPQPPIGERQGAADKHDQGAEPDHQHLRLEVEAHRNGPVGVWVADVIAAMVCRSRKSFPKAMLA